MVKDKFRIKHVVNRRCFCVPSRDVTEASGPSTKYTLCTVHAISPHSVNECCLKHLGSDLRLWCVSNDSAFPLQTKLSALIEMLRLNYGKWRLFLFSNHYSSACKYQISVPLNWIVLEWYAFKNCSLSRWLGFHRKSLSEFWFGIRAEFPVNSEMALNVVLPFCAMSLCKAAFPTRMTWNQNTSQCCKRLKMPHGPQHQIFNQDFIIFVKISKHILLLVDEISFISNK